MELYEQNGNILYILDILKIILAIYMKLKLILEQLEEILIF